MFRMLRNIALAGVTALAFAGISAVPASAYWHGYHHHGFHHYGFHRHFGPAFGFSFGAPYYAYRYGPDCAVRRVVRFNRFGERVVVWRRVCY